MSWLSSIFKDKQPEIQTKEMIDPLKERVANPLSSYLSNNVGKGLPMYENAPSVDENVTNRYKEFLGQNANDMFDKYVQGPQTEAFKRDFLPNLEEGYAGALRGSGRYRSEEDAINKFQTDLSGLRYTANKELPLAQLDAATKYYDLQDKQYALNYNNWFSSLPENNPVLKQAADFLSNNTSSGTTVLAQGVPGQQAPIWDILGTMMANTKTAAGAAGAGA